MYSFIIKEGGDMCSADNSLRPQVGCVQFPDSSLTLRGRKALRPEYCEYCEYLGAEAGEGEGWEGAGRGGRERAGRSLAQRHSDCPSRPAQDATSP